MIIKWGLWTRFRNLKKISEENALFYFILFYWNFFSEYFYLSNCYFWLIWSYVNSGIGGMGFYLLLVCYYFTSRYLQFCPHILSYLSYRIYSTLRSYQLSGKMKGTMVSRILLSVWYTSTEITPNPWLWPSVSWA